MMRGRNGGIWYKLNAPYLVILGAKKSTTVAKHESEAELMGQLRVLMLKQYLYVHDQVLMSSSEVTKMGFLTDGYWWRLFQFDSEFNLYFSEFIVDSDEKSLQMLGTFSVLIFSDKSRSLDSACGRSETCSKQSA